MSTTIPPIDRLPRRSSRPGEPPWEVALLFPAQGDWSERDYLALDTNRFVELSEGCLEVLPMPTILHQLIVQFLHKVLEAHVRAHAAGLVLLAPLPVRLRAGTYREPDVVYLRPGRIHDVRTQPDGADLVMEVLSEGEENRKRDLEIKREDYAQAGIPEYWVIDPEERRIAVLKLDGTTYLVHGEFGAGTQATSAHLPGFSVAVDDVFAAADVATE
jgi:Uma2 family endonuclease